MGERGIEQNEREGGRATMGGRWERKRRETGFQGRGGGGLIGWVQERLHNACLQLETEPPQMLCSPVWARPLPDLSRPHSDGHVIPRPPAGLYCTGSCAQGPVSLGTHHIRGPTTS